MKQVCKIAYLLTDTYWFTLSICNDWFLFSYNSKHVPKKSKSSICNEIFPNGNEHFYEVVVDVPGKLMNLLNANQVYYKKEQNKASRISIIWYRVR